LYILHTALTHFSKFLYYTSRDFAFKIVLITTKQNTNTMAVVLYTHCWDWDEEFISAAISSDNADYGWAMTELFYWDGSS
jgi:hypothetical protein